MVFGLGRHDGVLVLRRRGILAKYHL